MDSSKLKSNGYSSSPLSHVCNILKWKDYDGYGFDLVTRKLDGGHYISEIYAQSPASYSGLVNNDRIIEVNGINVEDKDHATVVNLIQTSKGDQISLLVVTTEPQECCRDSLCNMRKQVPGVVNFHSPVKRANSKTCTPPQEKFSVDNFSELENKTFHRFSAPEPPSLSLFNNSLTSCSSNCTHSVNHQEVVNHRSNEKPFTDSSKRSSLNLEVFKQRPEQEQLLEDVQNIHIISQSDLQSKSRFKICFLKKSLNRDDYGFKLNTVKYPVHKHIINTVKADGPAQECGLCEGDCLIEIDDINVENEPHLKVVSMIKESANEEIKLLVSQSNLSHLLIKHQCVTSSQIDEVGQLGLKDQAVNGTLKQFESKVDQVNLNQDGNKKVLNQSKSEQSKKDQSKLTRPKLKEIKLNYKVVEMPSDAPSPRLCCIRKEPNKEFGFTLRTYYEDGAKIMIDVNPGEAAFKAGVRQGDRIIEVNGINVNKDNHQQIETRINSCSEVLNLLLVTEKEYQWYHSKKMVPKSNQSNVIHLSNVTKTMSDDSPKSHSHELRESSVKQESILSKSSNGSSNLCLNTSTSETVSSKCADSNESSNSNGASNDNKTNECGEQGSDQNSQAETVKQSIDLSGQESLFDLLENYSAQEMQQHLATHKGKCNRKETRDFKKRIEIFEKL